MARNLRFPQVTAIDISEDALAVAEENARTLKARINFMHEDVFVYEPSADSFDIIVSNPPYIDESEKKDVEKNVLDYEPHLALFVSDDAPLVYYSRIADIGRKALSGNGRLYFEINPRHALSLKALLEREGYRDVRIIEDSSRKQRFIACVK